MILQALYFIICSCLIWKLWRKSLKKSSSAPPHLTGGLPLIGHAWMLLGDRKHAFNIMKYISKEILEKGGVLTVSLGFREMYVISDPDDCAKISNECLEKDYHYNFAKPFLGNGLTIADVPTWKMHRKLISPAFQQKILNDFLVVFNNQARRLVNQFRSKVGKGSFNHEKHIRLNSLESICLTAFGADVSDLGGLHRQYLRGVNEILDVLTERFQKVWLHNNFIYKRSKLKKSEDAIIKNIEEFTSVILAKRKAEIENTKKLSDKSGQFTPFMNIILDLSKESGCYTDKDILYEINTIVGGAYDTSACTSTLALMLLGSHPEVQKKACEELQEIFGNSNRDIGKDDLRKMVYLEAILKETLRLYPIAPIIARFISKDVQLKNYTLKAGNGIGILFWAMHRHESWGPDAEQFRPERWLDGSLPNSPYAFGGFSIGRRACIGKTYAMMSLKTSFSHVLRNFKITSDISKMELEIDVVLKIAAGQSISIEERQLFKE